MLFYINIGLCVFVCLNLNTCLQYCAKYYIICELYITELFYRNKNSITYYSITDLSEKKSFQTTDRSMLAKIEYKDIVRYIISTHEIKPNEIEQIVISPKLFLSVELTYNNNKIDVTSEVNMLVNYNSIEFNNKTAQIILFIKDNSNKSPINSIIKWGIITCSAEMYNTNYILFNIKENKLLKYKE